MIEPKRTGINSKEFLQLIEHKINRKYSLRHAQRILHRIGFSLITPSVSHIRKNEKAQQKFREGVFFWSNKKLIIFRAFIDGRKLFYEFYDSMNTLIYKAFLSSFIESLPEGKRYVFLFDNASYHKSSLIKNYLKEFNK
ncbi:MAG: winged helix-turn-helix domain-containing protein [Nanoarchaeota archaeon]